MSFPRGNRLDNSRPVLQTIEVDESGVVGFEVSSGKVGVQHNFNSDRYSLRKPDTVFSQKEKITSPSSMS